MVVVQQDSTPYWLLFNIGDSRVYRCVDGAMTQISVDHSVVQELVDSGRMEPEAARFHPERHIITRAVGTQESPHPDIWLIPAEAGERFLVCSDGLSGELDSPEIAAVVIGPGTPQEIADELVARALAAGGRDNVTAIVVEVLAVGADTLAELVLSGSWSSPDTSDSDSTRPRGRGERLLPDIGADA